MRSLVWLVILLAAACKSGHGAQGQGAAARPADARVPHVEAAGVLAPERGEPPLLVVVDDAGALYLAAAATWAELAANDPLTTAKPAHADAVYITIREALGMSQAPAQTVASFKDFASAPATKDDPPPPPPQEEEEGARGARESGAAGLLRREDTTIPEVDDVRVTGAPGALHVGKPVDDRDPARLATVSGQVAPDSEIGPRQLALVVAAPRAKATAVISAVTLTEGLIAVSLHGAIRVLRLQFHNAHHASQVAPQWIEAQVSAAGVAIEAVPDVATTVPWTNGTLVPTALAKALDDARAARGTNPLAPIDVLVAPDLDAQQLIDVLVALDLAGVRTIALGPAPAAGSPEAAKRGHRTPRVRFERPQSMGDLDKADIMKVVTAQEPQLVACYQAGLATKPALAGLVHAQFFIDAAGHVLNSAAVGVDPEVATCVQGLIQKLVFPKPRGGGGVQVNYPMTMRQ